MKKTLSSELYIKSREDKNAAAKALAHYMFSGVIEEAQKKYGISQEDMNIMYEDALNRAAALIRSMGCTDPIEPLTAYFYDGEDSTFPNEEQVNRFMNTISEAEEHIHNICQEIIRSKLDH
ncbi:MAG: hypothetical protein ACI4JK_12770 [Oscillospiraceae bacterium]